MNKIIAITSLIMLFLATGCGRVDREFTVDSEPAGALVEVNGRPIGVTPVTFSFTFYGDYEVVLRKEGYETLFTSVDIKPPVYQYPGIDFFVEMAPGYYHDKRGEVFRLVKKQTPSEVDLLKRADEMKERLGGGD